jgi:hypothetical protein
MVDHQAGKGDKRRPEDRTLYSLGHDMLYAPTKEARETARKEWTRLKGIKFK